MDGFLGTDAGLWSDISLITTIILGIIAAYGGIQARKKRFSKHCPIMAVAAFLNWIPVLVVMIPTWVEILQGSENLITGAFSSAPIFHGILGGFTQVLMTYTVTRMYWLENLPPKKPIWLMRTTIFLWLLTVIGGIGVYSLAYVVV